MGCLFTPFLDSEEADSRYVMSYQQGNVTSFQNFDAETARREFKIQENSGLGEGGSPLNREHFLTFVICDSLLVRFQDRILAWLSAVDEGIKGILSVFRNSTNIMLKSTHH